MKNAKKLFLLVCMIILAVNVSFAFSDRFEESSSGWLRGSVSGGDNNGRPYDDGTGTPVVNPDVTSPVGDALWLTLGLGLSYGFYLTVQYKKSLKIKKS
jgi:hypothetical protein